MAALWQLPLIRLLDFYLAVMLLVSVYRRFQQYQTLSRLALSGPGRWPNLLKLIGKQRAIFLTWKTATPALAMLGLWLAQLVASRLLWPGASKPPDRLDLEFLAARWPTLLYLAPLGIVMVAFDLWGVIDVGVIDRGELEKHFDKAEYWLRSPAAHVVRVATFGFINPRKMVHDELRAALTAAGDLVHYNLWWLTTQLALRLGFALALWLTWAFI